MWAVAGGVDSCEERRPVEYLRVCGSDLRSYPAESRLTLGFRQRLTASSKFPSYLG